MHYNGVIMQHLGPLHKKVWRPQQQTVATVDRRWWWYWIGLFVFYSCHWKSFCFPSASVHGAFGYVSQQQPFRHNTHRHEHTATHTVPIGSCIINNCSRCILCIHLIIQKCFRCSFSEINVCALSLCIYLHSEIVSNGIHREQWRKSSIENQCKEGERERGRERRKKKEMANGNSVASL